MIGRFCGVLRDADGAETDKYYDSDLASKAHPQTPFSRPGKGYA
jgi:hypothetical protein